MQAPGPPVEYVAAPMPGSFAGSPLMTSMQAPGPPVEYVTAPMVHAVPGLRFVEQFCFPGGSVHVRALEPESALANYVVQGVKLGDEGMRIFSEMLAKHRTLGMPWDVSNMGFTASGVVYLASALQTTPCISLELKDNQIGDQGVENLAEAIAASLAIRYIGLEGNGISDAGAQILAEAVGNLEFCTVLNLRNNNIGSEGARHLANMSAFGRVRRTVDLSDNPIGDEGLVHLFEAARPIEINLSQFPPAPPS